MLLETLKTSFATKPGTEMFSTVNDCELRTSKGSEYLPRLKGWLIIGRVPLRVSVMFPVPVPLRVPVTLVEPPSGTVVFSIAQVALKFTDTGPLELRKETFPGEPTSIAGAAFTGMESVELTIVNTRHAIINTLMSLLFIVSILLISSQERCFASPKKTIELIFQGLA
jgi:hypothetical protein